MGVSRNIVMDTRRMGSWSLNRRQMLAGSVWVPFVAASSVHAAPPPAMQVGDAHAHLFNAADLPIAGFAKYVLFDGVVGRFRFGRAIVDVLTTLASPFAIGAERERKAIDGPSAPPEEIDARQFGEKTALLVEQRLAEAAASGADEDQLELAESHQALAEAAVADAGYSLELFGMQQRAMKASPISESNRDFAGQVNAMAFARAVERAENPLYVPPGAVVGDRLKSSEWRMALMTTPRPDADYPGWFSKAMQQLAWAKRMMESRVRHLTSYLRNYDGARYKTGVIVNHLVDYDLWLDDGPRGDSGHEAQIEFFAALANQRRGSLNIQTFAGYCPLKHAIERRRGVRPWFDRLKEHHAAGRIAGFKIYPPMGFQPWGNAELPDRDFDPKPASRKTALDQWKAVAGNASLGKALDEALGEFYTYCADHGAPVMAHAGPGNGAGPKYGDRANPKYWESVLRRHRLRLSLGHLVNDAKPFVNAAENDDGRKVWFLDASRRLLSPDFAGGSAYGDLGYMPELIYDPALAVAFFVKLKKLLGPRDPKLTRILYGTDWIMLGSEPRNDRMLSAVVAAMAAAGYDEETQANILSRNLGRFLSGKG